jgi:hypothetical protein
MMRLGTLVLMLILVAACHARRGALPSSEDEAPEPLDVDEASPPTGSRQAARVVLQIIWGELGVCSPTRRWCAAWEDYSPSSLRVIDVRNRSLAWVVPIEHPRDADFSADGRWLAACGDEGGLLFDLQSGDVRVVSAFEGELIRFVPQSDRVLIARITPRSRRLRQNELRLLELDGTLLRSIPTSLTVAGRLELDEDGVTARLVGLVGNRAMHVPMMGLAEQRVNLATGASHLQRQPSKRGYPTDRRPPSLPDDLQPPSTTLRNQRSAAIFVDDSATVAVLEVSTGSTEDGVAAAWDVRNARFLRVLEPSSEMSRPRGFLDGELMANCWAQQVERLSLIDVVSGEVRQTPLDAIREELIPRGAHFVFESHQSVDGRSVHLLELYGVPVGSRIYSTSLDDGLRRPWLWSERGRYFMHTTFGAKTRSVVLVNAADGSSRELDLFEISKREATDPERHLSVFSAAANEDLGRLAVGIGDVGKGMIILADLDRLTVTKELGGFPIWPSALRWIDRDRLLVGYNETVQLYDVTKGRPLWSTKLEQEVLQFEQAKGSPVVTCSQIFRGAALLRLNDGLLIKTGAPLLGSDQAIARPWTNLPQIANGRAALELLPDQRSMHLIDTKNGAVVLTYASFPGEQWVVHTPQGHWDGSEGVVDWVAFYRGAVKLGPSEVAALRSRPHIEKVLNKIWSGPPR